MRVKDSAVELEKRERNHFVEVAHTVGAIGRLARAGGELRKTCETVQAGLLELLANGETIGLADPPATAAKKA